MDIYQEMLSRVKKPVKPPHGNPWNPGYVFVFSSFLGFTVASIGLALNWRRLGKPNWAMPTFALGVVYLLMIVVVLTDGLPQTTLPPRVSFSLFFGCIVVPLVLMVMISYLQYGAYQKWDKNRDTDGMLTHRYEFRKGILVALTLFVILFIIGHWQFYESFIS